MTLSSDAGLRTFANLRDLGGLPLASGGVTMPNVLIRSDAPYPADEDPAGGCRGRRVPSSTCGTPTEIEPIAVTWPSGVRVVNRQVSSSARIDRLADTALIEIYSSVIRTGQHRLTAALNEFDSTGSTLVHCAAGKDRTGMVVAIALLLAGGRGGFGDRRLPAHRGLHRRGGLRTIARAAENPGRHHTRRSDPADSA